MSAWPAPLTAVPGHRPASAAAAAHRWQVGRRRAATIIYNCCCPAPPCSETTVTSLPFCCLLGCIRLSGSYGKFDEPLMRPVGQDSISRHLERGSLDIGRAALWESRRRRAVRCLLFCRRFAALYFFVVASTNTVEALCRRSAARPEMPAVFRSWFSLASLVRKTILCRAGVR